ncbi:MAG: hypothetical protein H7Y00_01005 [Fimbriimonadaceae bacterium]|nr:hypothetical protein [Chitinophagales bacterium]
MNIKTKALFFFLTVLFFISCKEKTENNNSQTALENTIVLDDSSTVKINTSSSLANDVLLLQFKPVNGTKYNMTMDMQYDMITNAMGQEMKQKMSMSMGSEMEVKGVDADGNTTLASQYKKMKMDMDMGVMKMQYESGKLPEDEMGLMMSKVFEPFINAPLTITLDKSAKVKSVTGFDEIKKKIEAQVGEGAAGSFDQMNNMEENIQGSFAYLPNKEVKIGDTWQQELQIDIQQYPMNMKSIFTLIDRKDGIAVIAMQSTMAMNNAKLNKDEMQQMGIEDMSVSGTSSGTLQVDESTGWTKSANITQNIKMDITAQGQKMPMTMKGTLKMKSE